MTIAEAIDMQLGSLKLEGSAEAVNKLLEELAKAQIEFDPVMEDATGQAGSRNFKYADYSSLTRATRPYLVKHGITLLQPLHSENGNAVTTTILAGHGARISSSFSFKADPNPQDFGKNHTYYRRYQLQAMLGLAGEDADDAKLSLAAKEKNGFSEPKKTEPKKVDAVSGTNEKPQPKQPPQESSKPAPQAAVQEAPKAETAKSAPTDAKPINARIVNAMKQLEWNMDNLKAFYKEHIDKKGFDKADNLPAPVKEKLYELLIEKKQVAPF